MCIDDTMRGSTFQHPTTGSECEGFNACWNTSTRFECGANHGIAGIEAMPVNYGGGGMEYEYEIHDGDEYFASSWSCESDENALTEARRYAAQCDNPKIYRVVKTLI